MNSSQKKTFYLFLSLYLISTYILLGTIAYNYYESKKKWIHMEVHDELNKKSAKISMQLSKHKDTNYKELKLSNEKFDIEFIDDSSNKYPKEIFNIGVFDEYKQCKLATKVSISNNKWGFVIIDKTLRDKKENLKIQIVIIFFIIIILVGIFGYILAKLFLKPINDHIENLNNFIKDIHHELNTPVTSLMMSSDQLKKQYDERLVNNISISSKQLFEIYKSLIEINFSQKDTRSNINLKDLLENSLKYFTEILSSKKIKVNYKFDDYIFNANAEKLQRVFNNLVSNAIKYSHPNSTIEIYLKENILIVKDYGVGIKKENQDKIFLRYYQSNDSVRGFGIGLDIIKKICAQYNIKIELESYENKSTTFKLIF